MVKQIRIGTGAGYSGDRIEPAVKLAKSGNLDYLVFECLAERTVALAQKRKLLDPEKGYDPLLEERMKRILPYCTENGTKIITNMGAANPLAAGKLVAKLAKDLGLDRFKVGIVLGDDILEELLDKDFSNLKKAEEIIAIKDRIISANVYIGSSAIIEALAQGADIIITGRTCDPSLFLAPMMFEFGWKEDDWDKIGWGIAIAHLLECGGQVTGGYFADPGYKDVEGLANLGFPIAEVFENGDANITKLPGSGGEVSLRTCKEQLLYEIHDPSSYATADGFADLTTIRFEEVGKDIVKVTGGGGRERPKKLKVSMGYRNGYVGEAGISYGGQGALQRAQLAANILKERFRNLKLDFEELRFDLIDVNSIRSDGSPSPPQNEVRLRVVGRCERKENAKKLCNEVEALYTNGPAGGGGVIGKVEESIGIASAFILREEVKPTVKMLEVSLD